MHYRGNLDRGWQTDIANELGVRLGRKVAPQAVQYMANRANSSELTADFASITGVSYEWLARGVGQMIQQETHTTFQVAEPSTEAWPPEPVMSKGKLPVISWASAGPWDDTFDPYAPGVADEWLDCPVSYGEGTFILQVRGTSMYNPDARSPNDSYADGEYIYCDPTKVPPRHGQDVIARLPDRDETTFKRFQMEGNTKYLIPLNPNWPEKLIPLNEKAYCKAVVIGSFFRRS